MATSRPPSLRIGDVLAGKYRVDGVLGRGGMAVVHSAVHVALDRRVAIKVLLDSALDDEEAVARFLREGRAAARLRSAHVARVLDCCLLEDGRPYLVLEHLEGHDLASVVAAPEPTAIEDAASYVVQACEAVAEAHERGIVHRDLKPKNLFLTRTPSGKPLVKVLDFGISKLTREEIDPRLTATGQLLGSPSYMSPEQLRSSRYVDARTDVWALGVILYELLTKRVPFEGENLTEIVSVVLTETEPRVDLLRPDVPRELADIVARCLAKRLDERFARASDLAAALAPFAGASSVEAEPSTPVLHAPARDFAADRARQAAAETTVVTPPPSPSALAADRELSTDTSWVRMRPVAPTTPGSELDVAREAEAVDTPVRRRSRREMVLAAAALAAAVLSIGLVERGLAGRVPRVAVEAAPHVTSALLLAGEEPDAPEHDADVHHLPRAAPLPATSAASASRPTAARAPDALPATRMPSERRAPKELEDVSRIERR